VFWDPRSRTFSAWSDGAEHDGHGPAADFWWAAQLWDVVIDEADRTRSPDALATVDAVYDGFLARHPTFVSDFNDDRGWWALAATRAYDLTDERRYLDRARSLLDGILASEDGSLGGGIWWRRSVHDQKNVATNAPAVMTASRLCTLTAERRDCDAAEALFSWLDRTLRDGSQVLDHVDSAGRRVDWSFSYNYGTFLAAALGAANAQPASDHGAAAKLRLLAGTVGDRAIAELSSDAVLRPDGDGDGGGFRGIFVRALASAAEELGRPDWSAFVAANADAVWRARRSDGLVGSSWVHPEGGLVESLTAASAVAVLEAAAIP
jgi:predicted alpha-1,6-mannanase (GH76 family)